MKLYDRKRIALVIFSIIVGMGFAAFILYNQNGEIGQTEIIALILTAIIAVTISLLVIKKANK